jgi:hypothetical protein
MSKRAKRERPDTEENTKAANDNCMWAQIVVHANETLVQLEKSHPDIQVRFWAHAFLKNTYSRASPWTFGETRDFCYVFGVINEEMAKSTIGTPFYFVDMSKIPSKDRLHYLVLCKKEEFNLLPELKRLIATYL